MKYLLSIILNVAVGQNEHSLKIAVGQKCREPKMPSVQNSVGQNGRRSKLRRFWNHMCRVKNSTFAGSKWYMIHNYLCLHETKRTSPVSAQPEIRSRFRMFLEKLKVLGS
jgi:hypothetical protein